MKKALVILLAAALALPFGLTTAFAAYTDANVSVNGTAVAYPDQKPYNDSEIGRVFVPLRATLNAFGYDDENILWNQETKTVTTTDAATNTTTEIDLVKNTWKITQDESAWEGKLDVDARLENNRTMVPIRTFSETYFKNVGWAQESQTVLINDVYADETIPELDPEAVNGLVKGEFVKVPVSSDGTYKWNIEMEGGLVFIGENAEGAGNYSMYFNAIEATEGDTEFLLTLTPVAVDESAVLPEAKIVRKYTVKEPTTEVPNPRTEYDTLEALKEAFGADPFVLKTAPEGLKDTTYTLISGSGKEDAVAEVVYTTEAGEIMLRCASKEMGEEITGVYGVADKYHAVEGLNSAIQCGETKNVDGSVIRVAYGYVASLGMTFSVACEDGCTEDAFHALLATIPEFAA